MAEFPNVANAKEVAMALKFGDMAKVLVALNGTQSSAHFVVMELSPSQVHETTITRNCRLMLPAWFIQEHGRKLKLQDFVVLRSASSTLPCRVRLRVTKKTPNNSETYFGKGWKAFATSNKLLVGDSLIFQLRGMSEFEVHIFRGTGLGTTDISSSQAPKDWSTDSENSRKNGNYDSSAGCSRLEHLPAERSDGSLLDDMCEVVAKKRKVGEEGAVQYCTPENSSFIKLRLSELENVQVHSSLEKRQDLQDSQAPPVDHQRLKVPFNENESAQNTDVRKVHVKKEFQQAKVSLPSFIQRLAENNVRDSAGNTSGARFDVPLSFVKTHGIRLQPHVKLQGIREESPFRTVTCSYNMLQDSEERSRRPPLSLGWGDFVRDNVLQAGQELVFTLASESFFVVREVSEIVVYTK